MKKSLLVIFSFIFVIGVCGVVVAETWPEATEVVLDNGKKVNVWCQNIVDDVAGKDFVFKCPADDKKFHKNYFRYNSDRVRIAPKTQVKHGDDGKTYILCGNNLDVNGDYKNYRTCKDKFKPKVVVVPRPYKSIDERYKNIKKILGKYDFSKNKATNSLGVRLKNSVVELENGSFSPTNCEELITKFINQDKFNYVEPVIVTQSYDELFKSISLDKKCPNLMGKFGKTLMSKLRNTDSDDLRNEMKDQNLTEEEAVKKWSFIYYKKPYHNLRFYDLGNGKYLFVGEGVSATDRLNRAASRMYRVVEMNKCTDTPVPISPNATYCDEGMVNLDGKFIYYTACDNKYMEAPLTLYVMDKLFLLKDSIYEFNGCKYEGSK